MFETLRACTIKMLTRGSISTHYSTCKVYEAAETPVWQEGQITHGFRSGQEESMLLIQLRDLVGSHNGGRGLRVGTDRHRPTQRSTGQELARYILLE
jgi:hypothetical protein